MAPKVIITTGSRPVARGRRRLREVPPSEAVEVLLLLRDQGAAPPGEVFTLGSRAVHDREHLDHADLLKKSRASARDIQNGSPVLSGTRARSAARKSRRADDGSPRPSQGPEQRVLHDAPSLSARRSRVPQPRTANTCAARVERRRLGRLRSRQPTRRQATALSFCIGARATSGKRQHKTPRRFRRSLFLRTRSDRQGAVHCRLGIWRGIRTQEAEFVLVQAGS